MPLGFLGNVFGNAIAAGASMANTRQVNEMNYKIAQDTNANNRLLVEMQNEAAKEEAELAYKRSTAGNQVNQLRGAGMSLAGALNTLNGGGSYTPAPVNTSQDSVPQMQTADLSALANIGQGLEAISQRKHEEKLQEKQLAAAKEQHQAQLQSNERIAQLQADTTNRNADNALEHSRNMLEWEKTKYDKLPEYEKKRYDIAFELLTTQKDIENWRLEDLKYRVLEYQSKEYKSTRDAQNLLEGLAAEMDYNLSNKEMKEFRDTYMYFDSNSKEWKYKPVANNSAGKWLYETAPRFWDFAARVLPANKLADVISRALAQSK